eukprot:3399014-Amphidinium_carterae.2
MPLRPMIGSSADNHTLTKAAQRNGSNRREWPEHPRAWLSNLSTRCRHGASWHRVIPAHYAHRAMVLEKRPLQSSPRHSGPWSIPSHNSSF